MVVFWALICSEVSITVPAQQMWFFHVIAVVSLLEATETLLHLVYYCFLCQAHQSLWSSNDLPFRAHCSYILANMGNLKRMVWKTWSKPSWPAKTSDGALVPGKLERIQVRREKHYVTVLLDNTFIRYVMGLLPKIPRFRNPTSEHWEMKTTYLII